MKDFREQHPTPDSLDDVGVRRLAAAIVLQTAIDYWDEMCFYFANSRSTNRAIMALNALRGIDLEMHSPFWSSITDITPYQLRTTLVDMYRDKKDPLSILRKWYSRMEDASPVQDAVVYYEPSYLINLLNNPMYSANNKKGVLINV